MSESDNVSPTLSLGYVVRQLTTNDCRAVVELQERVVSTLAPGDACFSANKTEAQIRENLTDPHYGIGAFSDEALPRLVGTSFLLTDQGASLYANTDARPIEISTVVRPYIGTVVTVLVDPEFTGRKVMPKLLSHIWNEAACAGMTCIMARIVGRNTPSLKNFEGFGYEVVRTAMGHDGEERVFLRQSVSAPRAPVRKLWQYARSAGFVMAGCGD